MGKIKQGILGGFSGKVGTVVGSFWKGISYIRALAPSIANPRTPAQVNQRTKFSAVIAFLQPIQAFINVGFKAFADGKSAMNAAMSYNVMNAMTGTAPNFTVDYANALVSRGKLTGIETASASENTGTLTVTWTANSEEGNASDTDKALVLVYNPTRNEAKVVLESGAVRQDGTLDFALPAHYSGDTVHVYLSFQTEDNSIVSNSRHVGTVSVA